MRIKQLMFAIVVVFASISVWWTASGRLTSVRAQDESPAVKVDGFVLPFPPTLSASANEQRASSKGASKDQLSALAAHNQKVADETQESGKRPNILLIVPDDVGYWNVGAYSHGMMVPTPNIDRIAKEGMLFTDHYAQPTCTPGRAALITGQLPIRTGLTTVGMIEVSCQCAQRVRFERAR